MVLLFLHPLIKYACISDAIVVRIFSNGQPSLHLQQYCAHIEKIVSDFLCAYLCVCMFKCMCACVMCECVCVMCDV